MLIVEAKYQCDFCEKQIEFIAPYSFDATWDKSHHTAHHNFELCGDCHSKVSSKNFVTKALVKFFKIGMKK